VGADPLRPFPVWMQLVMGLWIAVFVAVFIGIYWVLDGR